MKVLSLVLLIFLSANILACTADESTVKPVTEPVEESPSDSVGLPENSTDSLAEAAFKITIAIGQQVLNGTLYDNPTTRDFISLLPLTLTLSDYSNFEKISILPKRLTTSGAAAGSTPSAGDIAFYSPWGNLALFHRGFSYSTGLVMMGKFDSDIAILRTPGEVEAKIEMVQQTGD